MEERVLVMAGLVLAIVALSLREGSSEGLIQKAKRWYMAYKRKGKGKRK